MQRAEAADAVRSPKGLSLAQLDGRKGDLDDVEGVGAAASCRRSSRRSRSFAASSAIRLFQPDAPYPVPQPCRLVVLVDGILYLNQFPRRADRRPRRKPDDAGRDHRRRDRRVGDGRDQLDHIDPEKLLELQAGESLTPVPNDDNLDFPINPEKVAPVLRRLISPTRTRARIYRPRRQSAARFAPSLFARPDPALRPAAGRGREPDLVERTRNSSSNFFRNPATCRSTRSSRAATAPLSRSGEGADRQRGDHRAHHRTGRADRFGRGADPALPRRSGRAAAVDRRRRYRQDRRMPSARDHARLRRRGPGQRASCRCCCLDHRQSAAPAVGGRGRVRRGVKSARKSPIFPTARTRSAICRSRYAT
jgi:hypothetical protein